MAEGLTRGRYDRLSRRRLHILYESPQTLYIQPDTIVRGGGGCSEVSDTSNRGKRGRGSRIKRERIMERQHWI